MRHLRHWIREVHRRSLWQIVSIYLVGSWGALQVVEGITENAGLPDWVPPFALVLLVLGLPMVVATAFVQEDPAGDADGPARSRADAAVAGEAVGGAPSGGERRAAGAPDPRPPVGAPAPEHAPPGIRHRLFTWRNFVLGGLGAFTLLAVAVGAYFFMWSRGIGPVGSLAAQGVFEGREAVILADFANHTDDPRLADVVTQAFRVDLVQSPALKVLDPAYVREILTRMQVDGGATLTPELAREAAVREGMKAVVQGEVGRAGDGYILTASVVAAPDGRTLAAFRETASDDSGILEAIDRLSQHVREKAGESLQSIKGEAPLERVTTSSLPALRLFSEANRAFERGDLETAAELLEEAVVLDPGFAMAWRFLSVTLNNSGLDRARMLEAARRAWDLRGRLTPIERHLATAFYHSQVTQDREEVIAAYRRVLATDPDNGVALNNLANVYASADEHEQAAELYRRAVSGPGTSPAAFGNLVDNRVAAGRLDEAMATVDAWTDRYPGSVDVPAARAWVLLAGGDPEAAIEAVRAQIDDATVPASARIGALDVAARAELWRGRIGEARRLLERAERIAAQQAPAFGWLRTLWNAYYEAWVGDPDRAAALVTAFREEGGWDALDPGSRFHFFLALVLGELGAEGDLDAVVAEWRIDVPPEARGREDSLFVEVARARAEMARGDAAASTARLVGVRESWPCRHCFSVELAETHLGAGRTGAAIPELESAVALRDAFEEIDVPHRLRALRLLGPAYEALGDTAGAIEAYRRLAEQWAEADPELQPHVREARERVAALGPPASAPGGARGH